MTVGWFGLDHLGTIFEDFLFVQFERFERNLLTQLKSLDSGKHQGLTMQYSKNSGNLRKNQMDSVQVVVHEKTPAIPTSLYPNEIGA